MNNTTNRLQSHELQRLIYRFINDPVRLNYLKALESTLKIAVPVVLMNPRNGEITHSFKEPFLSEIEHIKNLLKEYDEKVYGDLLNNDQFLSTNN